MAKWAQDQFSGQHEDGKLCALKFDVKENPDDTIRAKSITCSSFFLKMLCLDYSYSLGVRSNYFQLQSQPRSRHGINFQLQLKVVARREINTVLRLPSRPLWNRICNTCCANGNCAPEAVRCSSPITGCEGMSVAMFGREGADESIEAWRLLDAKPRHDSAKSSTPCEWWTGDGKRGELLDQLAPLDRTCAMCTDSTKKLE